MSELPITSELPPEESNTESSPEAGPERIPTREDVLAVMNGGIHKIIDRSAGIENLKTEITLEKHDDEGVLRVLEMTFSGDPESESTKIEATYIKAGSFAGYSRLTTGIDLTYYDSNGVPCGGPYSNVFELIDDELRPTESVEGWIS
ncbi:MAG: hypothetical protein KBB54_02635 [Candidatus Pacebacteria bacterium]|nr:hypothetical protein [Candidatus Paceibacterota bacterium]MBP9818660.1 hypothetical protein [Candidatus Paceibacterota bacterium]